MILPSAMYKSGKSIKVNGKKINMCEFDCEFTMTDAMGISGLRMNPLIPHIIRVCESHLIGNQNGTNILPVRPVAQSSFNFAVYNRLWQAYAGFMNWVSMVDVDTEWRLNAYTTAGAKLKVIENRMSTDSDYDCMICMEPIPSIGTCLVSTCCFTLFCHTCISSYQCAAVESKTPNRFKMIKLASPCCGIPAWSIKYSITRTPTKLEQIGLLVRAYNGANIVVYAPMARCDIFENYLREKATDISAKCCRDPFDSECTMLFINNQSLICKNLDWSSIAVFIDCSDGALLKSKKSVILNIISKSFMYVKLNYSM